ncbi:MAG: PH domain-containing protein [Acidimicrobiales bacterium]|nr:PH domain-containing protein [Acidimicrobiales bacterium]
MAYPRDLLNQGEKLVLDLRPHWLFLVPSGGALLAAIIGSLLILVGWSPDGTVGSIMQIVCAIAVVGTAGWFGLTYLKWSTTNFVLTSDRLISRVGIVAKEGLEIPLERINTVFSSQSVFERIVGAGDLAIESAGERGTQHFTDIRKPAIVQKEIYIQIENNENRKFDRMRGSGAAPGAVDPTLVQGGQSIPEQIEKLAELHQRGVLSDAEYQRKKAELLDRM